MGVLVAFHAHPDDESISSGGTLARAVKEGHTVVLVVATGGEHGERPSGVDDAEALAAVRRRETQESCAVLGIQHLEWLGYHDSGMTGWPQNSDKRAFMNAPVEEAAEQLAAILKKYGATVLTTYDWHGNYGHPDHISVHKVGYRAAEIAGVNEVYEATMNRDSFRRLQEMARGTGEVAEGEEFDVDGPADDGNPMGMPENELTHRIDVSSYLEQKRESLFKHASQITNSSFVSKMPPEVFALAFGTEWFLKRGVPTEPKQDWIFS